MSAAAPRWRKWVGWGVLALLLVLTFVARCHNLSQIFHHGGVYFVDGDCYSRMTRAKLVSEGQWILRHHDFENWPAGITPHTTAPLDWIIVGLKPVAAVAVSLADPSGKSVLHRQTLDLSGAFVSPLLGVLTAAWLWWWAGRMRLQYRAAMVLLFALSPIAVHGTVLGRPDHQSLLMLLLAVALGCEARLACAKEVLERRRSWAVAAGCAWGIALWVSLYEPLVLLACVLVLRVIFNRRHIVSSEGRWEWAAVTGFCAIGLLVDGWRITVPDAGLRESFVRWSATIGELRHLDPAGPLLWQWLGLVAALAPILLWLAGRQDRRAFAALAVVLVLFGLAVWQLRWGYFLLLAFAMSLPWQLAALRSTWMAWVVMLVGLWPVASSWSRTLHPGERALEDQAWRALSHSSFRKIAEKMRKEPRAAFLAPWWISPQLAYWSGCPGVGGSSHQSLPGTLDTARLFLTADPEKAAEILRRRKVGWVVADNASFDVARRDQLLAVTSSATLLGERAPEEPLALTLAERPREAPPFLREIRPAELGLVADFTPTTDVTPGSPGIKVYATQMHRLYRVEGLQP